MYRIKFDENNEKHMRHCPIFNFEGLKCSHRQFRFICKESKNDTRWRLGFIDTSKRPLRVALLLVDETTAPSGGVIMKC